MSSLLAFIIRYYWIGVASSLFVYGYFKSIDNRHHYYPIREKEREIFNPLHSPTPTMMNTTNISTIPLPYHSYNVFFILERALIIHERNGMQQISGSSAHEFNGYGPLDLPPPPPRYRQLESVLAPNWYIPGIRKLAKRKHVKSHGG